MMIIGAHIVWRQMANQSLSDDTSNGRAIILRWLRTSYAPVAGPFFSGPVYTASDVNVIWHQYEHKSAKKHVMWRCLSSRHARTHCVPEVYGQIWQIVSWVTPTQRELRGCTEQASLENW